LATVFGDNYIVSIVFGYHLLLTFDIPKGHQVSPFHQLAGLVLSTLKVRRRLHWVVQQY